MEALSGHGAVPRPPTCSKRGGRQRLGQKLGGRGLSGSGRELGAERGLVRWAPARREGGGPAAVTASVVAAGAVAAATTGAAALGAATAALGGRETGAGAGAGAGSGATAAGSATCGVDWRSF